MSKKEEAPKGKTFRSLFKVFTTMPDGQSICRCRCGKTFMANAEAIADGEITGCGCDLDRPAKRTPDIIKTRNPVNRIGDTTGYVTVYDMRRNHKLEIIWQWRCVCGYKGENRTHAVRQFGEHKTCGGKRCTAMMSKGLSRTEAAKILRSIGIAAK